MEQVSRRHWILVISLALAMVSSAAALLWRPVPAVEELPFQQAQHNSLQQPVAVEVPPYRVTIWQGRVAVFEGAELQPSIVLETQATSLPMSDQDALEKGIPVYSREELAGFLEDYGS